MSLAYSVAAQGGFFIPSQPRWIIFTKKKIHNFKVMNMQRP